MSFTLIQQATPRLHRSELAVPGSNPSLFEKAAKGAADIIFLDLEDAVAPDDKEQARKNIVQGLNDVDWGTKTMMIRINGLDTHYMYRDVVDIMEQAGAKLDTILIPKVGVPADVYTVERLGPLAEKAAALLSELGYDNVHVLHGDGTKGWPEHSPYDAIVVAAGGPQVPASLKEQLKVGGRLVIPVGADQRSQELVRITRVSADDYRSEDIADVRFVPLIGQEGWASTGVGRTQARRTRRPDRRSRPRSTRNASPAFARTRNSRSSIPT